MTNRLKITEDVIVFVDETGQEGLDDPNFPVFGLAGCVVPAKEYDTAIKQPWSSIYTHYFASQQTPLHAHQARAYSTEQKEAIADFFRKQPFLRVATVTHNKSKWPSELFRYQMIAGLFHEQLRQLLQVHEFNSVAMIFESCDRTNHYAKKYFLKKTLLSKHQKEIRIKGYLVQKSKNFRGVAGLEVADFIANAVGGRAKARATGDDRKRPDFQCIFTGTNYNQASFFELGDVDFNQKPQALLPDLKDWDLSWKLDFKNFAN